MIDRMAMTPPGGGHFQATGPRRPVLALHGAGVSGAQWRSLSAHLGDTHRVVSPDLPGHGTAGRHLGDVRDTADQLASAITLGDEPVHVVGHSHGAAVALELALLRPDLVRSLTLVEPSVFHLLRTSGDASDLKLLEEVSATAQRLAVAAVIGNAAAGMRALADFWHGAGIGAVSAAFPASALPDMERTAFDLATAFAETWPASRCASIRVPTLLVMGLQGPLASMRTTELLASAIPDSRLVMVHDAGHLMHVTDFQLKRQIAAHLRAADQHGQKAAPSWHDAA